MNMTLTEAMQRLEIFAGQQMSEDMETAIRTVLAEMKQKPEEDVVPVVRCKDCMHHKGLRCLMWNDADTIDGTYPNAYDEDYCSCGENTYTF